MRKTIFTFLLCLACIQAHCAGADEMKWVNYSSQQLETMGERYFSNRPAMEDSAIVCFTIIANRYTHKSSTEEARRCINALCRLWDLYFYSYYDYTSSYVCLMRAMEIGKERGIEHANTYFSLGGIYHSLADENGEKKNYELACRYFMRSFDISYKQKEWVMMTLSYINLLDIAAKTGNIERVRKITSTYRSVPLLREGIFASTYFYNDAMWNMLLCRSRHDYAGALRYSERQLSRLKHIPNDSRFLFNAYTEMAATYAMAGNFDKAVEATSNSLDIAKEFEMQDGFVEGNRRMAEYLTKTGRESEAMDYRQRYLDARSELQNYSQLMSSGEYHILSVVNNVNDRMKEMERTRTIYTIIIVVACLFSVCILAFLLVIRRKNRTLRNRNEALFDKYTALMQQDRTAKEKYQNSKLDDSDKERLASEIRKVLDSDAIFAPDFSLSELAKRVDSNSAYVSQAINQVMGQNFRSLLTSARIKEACRLLADESMGEKYSIDGIGRSVGFNSRSTFFATFKKETGITATEYRTIALNKKRTSAVHNA